MGSNIKLTADEIARGYEGHWMMAYCAPVHPYRSENEQCRHTTDISAIHHFMADSDEERAKRADAAILALRERTPDATAAALLAMPPQPAAAAELLTVPVAEAMLRARGWEWDGANWWRKGSALCDVGKDGAHFGSSKTLPYTWGPLVTTVPAFAEFLGGAK